VIATVTDADLHRKPDTLAAVVGGLERAGRRTGRGGRRAGASGQPSHPADPHRDLDLASYGVVAVLDHQHGTTYPDMTWEPKQAFGALAAAYAHAGP
jgi:hypothetical protein